MTSTLNSKGIFKNSRREPKPVPVFKKSPKDFRNCGAVFKHLNRNSVIDIIKPTNESINHTCKRIEIYNNALQQNFNEDIAIMLSSAYINKLKYGVIYNNKIEDLLLLISG